MNVKSSRAPGSPQREPTLLWILEEIQKTDKEYAENCGKDYKEKPGLRFRPGAEDEFLAISSPFGTLHDSRGGRSFFYRYSPRTKKLEGKDVTHDVVVHHTVVSRMLHGSDNYAPIVLPPDAKVLRSDGGMVPLQAYIESLRPKEAANYKTYKSNREHLLDKVWERQFYYFVMLATLLLLLFHSLVGKPNRLFGRGFQRESVVDGKRLRLILKCS